MTEQADRVERAEHADPLVAAEVLPPASGPGELLARARAARGLSVADVARQLRFSPRQIEALEAEHYEQLPGAAFVRGIARGYARLLGIDAEPLLEQIAQKVEVPDANRLAARYSEPVPFSDGTKRSNIAYAVLTVAVLAVAAYVLIEWRQERSGAARMTFVPAAKAPAETPRTAVASTAPSPLPPPPPASAVPPAAEPLPASAADSVKPAAEQPLAPGTAVAPSKPGAAVTPLKAAAATPAPHRIALRFARESWVEIRDASGKVVHTQLHPADSSAEVSGEPPFALVIGNAQHVEVSYDGEQVDIKPHIRVAVARFTLP